MSEVCVACVILTCRSLPFVVWGCQTLGIFFNYQLHVPGHRYPQIRRDPASGASLPNDSATSGDARGDLRINLRQFLPAAIARVFATQSEGPHHLPHQPAPRITRGLYPILRDSASGPEIGLQGRAGFRPDSSRDSLKFGPEDRFPARKDYCAKWCSR